MTDPQSTFICAQNQCFQITQTHTATQNENKNKRNIKNLKTVFTVCSFRKENLHIFIGSLARKQIPETHVPYCTLILNKSQHISCSPVI